MVTSLVSSTVSGIFVTTRTQRTRKRSPSRTVNGEIAEIDLVSRRHLALQARGDVAADGLLFRIADDRSLSRSARSSMR